MDEDSVVEASDRLLRAMMPPGQEATEPEEDQETPGDEPGVSDSDEPESEVADAEDDAEDEDWFEVSANGQTQRVRLQELVRAYQINAGSQKALQEAALARKEAQEALQRAQQQAQGHLTAAEQRRQYVEQRLGEVEALIGDVPEPDASLLQTDPIGYMEQQARYADFQKKLGQIRQKRAEIEQSRLHEINDRINRWSADQRNRLIQKHPELEKPEEFNRIISYLQREYGVSGQEIQNAVQNTPFLKHHAVWSAWYKAAKRDEAVSGQSKKAEPKSAPRVLPPGTAKKPQSVGARKLGETRAKFLKSGDVESASDHIAQLLRGAANGR